MIERSVECFRNLTPHGEILKPIIGKIRAHCVDCFNRLIAWEGVVVIALFGMVTAVEPTQENTNHSVRNYSSGRYT